jgi:hypothetical protein
VRGSKRHLGGYLDGRGFNWAHCRAAADTFGSIDTTLQDCATCELSASSAIPKYIVPQSYTEQLTDNPAYLIQPYSTGLAIPRWAPTQAVRLTVAAQLEALRILIAKISVSPGRIPALG